MHMLCISKAYWLHDPSFPLPELSVSIVRRPFSIGVLDSGDALEIAVGLADHLAADDGCSTKDHLLSGRST